ncbi:unnamed protein product [Staurois parvus]|uniref:Uncharacterized protein n=1 Tax=Staurois parvus TaxID=386267 RepID=A0ABN9CUF3_9NEOB|nr:unnamed protein product [Staurois parvus]
MLEALYFPKITSGYDAEHLHSTSLVDHGKACFEWKLRLQQEFPPPLQLSFRVLTIVL